LEDEVVTIRFSHRMPFKVQLFCLHLFMLQCGLLAEGI
jgi:hypothetical protein